MAMDWGWQDPLALFGLATAYASVGHGGASAYLVWMAQLGLPPGTMRPWALAFNLAASGLSGGQLLLRGHVPWRILGWLLVASMPSAYLGAQIPVPTRMFGMAIGLVLILSAAELWRGGRIQTGEEKKPKEAPSILLLGMGAGLGLLAGMLGIGGGIFLSPLLLLGGWCHTRQTAGASALFIFANSCAGLLGSDWPSRPFPWSWLAAVALGGLLGGHLASRGLSLTALRRLLALVLLLAGGKLVGI